MTAESSSDRLKILFAIPALDKGGPDRVIFEIIRKLDRNRFAPHLLVSEPGGYYRQQLPSDVAIHTIGPEKQTGRYPVKQSLRIIRREVPDVILATLRMTITMGMASYRFPAKTRLILRPANQFSEHFAVLIKSSPAKYWCAKWVSALSVKRAHAIVCQSRSMEVHYGKLVGPGKIIELIGNPIDLEATAKAAASESITLPGNPSLISVGRLAHQKGFDLLLRAFAIVKNDHPAVHLTILGEGPDRRELDNLAAGLGLSNSVTFAGFNPEPLPSINAADLFVLASRYEGFSNAALEAIGCGIPIVLFDTPGGHQEVVRPGFNGRLAPQCEPASLASTVSQVIAELPSYDRARIKADCNERFSSHRIVGAYENLFAKVAISMGRGH